MDRTLRRQSTTPSTRSSFTKPHRPNRPALPARLAPPIAGRYIFKDQAPVSIDVPLPTSATIADEPSVIADDLQTRSSRPVPLERRNPNNAFFHLLL
ncbi:unnamed protein product [Lactuca virosa]|uniref:Uncharacterized protein n=1 Tax=Lactuca virosa TaxID=75947 RepID=A0AAU9MCD1_9ASTR|nr:unnamed protein product [Lactuca virosa]